MTRPRPPLSAARRAAAEKAHRAVARKMASVGARPELEPDREIRRLTAGIRVALELNQAGLAVNANEILGRLIGPVPFARRQRKSLPDEPA